MQSSSEVHVQKIVLSLVIKHSIFTSFFGLSEEKSILKYCTYFKISYMHISKTNKKWEYFVICNVHVLECFGINKRVEIQRISEIIIIMFANVIGGLLD
jgi:hypothetical protein